jgi:hypothetical protein
MDEDSTMIVDSNNIKIANVQNSAKRILLQHSC